MNYIKKFNEDIDNIQNWKVYYINKRGDGWTSSISAIDLMDFIDKLKESMSDEEFKSIYKIIKY